jgi:predicted nucleotidyltransferase
MDCARVVQLLRDSRDYLRAEYGVSRIGLFGSVARGEADESSDVDIIVEFERPVGLQFVELADYLEDLLGRDVDLLTPAGIQAIRSPRIAESIRQGVVYV